MDILRRQDLCALGFVCCRFSLRISISSPLSTSLLLFGLVSHVLFRWSSFTARKSFVTQTAAESCFVCSFVGDFGEGSADCFVTLFSQRGFKARRGDNGARPEQEVPIRPLEMVAMLLSRQDLEKFIGSISCMVAVVMSCRVRYRMRRGSESDSESLLQETSQMFTITLNNILFSTTC